MPARTELSPDYRTSVSRSCGGIQVMVLSNRNWLERETQLAGQLAYGMPFGLGILMLLSSGLAWNSARLVLHRDRFLFSENNRQRLATIIESSEDAIIVERTDGTIGYWNAGAQSLFGYCSDEVINRPLEILVPDEQLPEMQQRHEAYLASAPNLQSFYNWLIGIRPLGCQLLI